MLMKLMLCREDYDASLRLRRLAAVALLALGLVGLACYFLLIPGSALPDFVQGFYLGASGGISFGALLLLCRSQYLLAHPAARRQAKIRETDEREVRILQDSFRWAGILTFYIAVVGLFVVLPLSATAFRALFLLVVLYSLSFLLFHWWLNRRL